jgi:hypothetical protein
MIVDISRRHLLLGVSFYGCTHTGVIYCDYGGITEFGDTAQEAFDKAFSYHKRLCREEESQSKLRRDND